MRNLFSKEKNYYLLGSFNESAGIKAFVKSKETGAELVIISVRKKYQ